MKRGHRRRFARERCVEQPRFRQTLARDGVTAEQAAYLQKHHDRAESAMAWLDAQTDDGWLTPTKSFGLAEIGLCTALEWMRFRNTYAIERHANLMRCLERHADRPSLAATRPSG